MNALKKLYRIAEAGEKGFATAAANVPDPALKVLFRLYAQERLVIKNELQAVIRDLGVDNRPSQSIPGVIHRGRVAIFAAMSADKKSQVATVLDEVALGEKMAARTYRSVLSKPLSPDHRDMTVRHLASIHKAQEQVACLRGQGDRQCVVRLFGGNQDTMQIVQRLIGAGLTPEDITTISITDKILYQEKGATIPETIASGAFGGALWGGVTGILAGFGVVETTGTVGFPAVLWTWLSVFVGFVFIGALISSILALFIGLHISGEDKYQYPAIRTDADRLVHLFVDKVRVDEVAKILDMPGASQPVIPPET